MAGSSIAELFIDLTLRGDPQVYLKSLKSQIKAMDNSLASGGKLFQYQAAGTVHLMGKVAERQKSLALMSKDVYASPKYAVASAKVAEANSVSRTSELTKTVAVSKAERDIERTQRGRDEALARAQVKRIQKQKEEAKNWNDLVAEKGKWGASLTVVQDKMTKIADTASSLSGNMGPGGTLVGMGIGALSMGSMIGAASPETLSTLTGSFKLLSAEIGTVFLPLILDVARQVQHIAFWFRNLDDATKDNIATWGKWVAIVGAGVTAVVTLGGALAMVAKSLAVMFSPTGVAIMAIATAVGALTVALMSFHATATENLSVVASANATRNEVANGTGGVSQNAFSTLPVAFRQRYLAAQTDEERQNIVQAAQITNQSYQEVANRDYPNANLAAAQGAVQADAQGLTQNAPVTTAVASFFNPALQAMFGTQIDTRETVMNRASQGQRVHAELRSEEAVLRGLQERGLAGVGGGDPMLYSSNFQSQNMSIEQGWKQVMQNSLSGGSLEARLQQVQLDNLPYLSSQLPLITQNTARPPSGNAP